MKGKVAKEAARMPDAARLTACWLCVSCWPVTLCVGATCVWRAALRPPAVQPPLPATAHQHCERVAGRLQGPAAHILWAVLADQVAHLLLRLQQLQTAAPALLLPVCVRVCVKAAEQQETRRVRFCGSNKPISACRWLWKGSTGQQGRGQCVACASGAAAAVKGQAQAAAQFLPRTWIPITFIHQEDRPTLRTDLGLSSGFAFGGTDVLTRPVAAARAT